MSTETQIQPQPAAIKLPGDLLREKREEKGLTQQDIATRLRLKLETIQKLELNEVDDDKQVATFVRGYYRNYAKIVSVPETLITEAVNQLLGDKVKQQPMTSFSKGAHRARHNKRISRLSWAIFIAVAGISAVWYWQSLQHGESIIPSFNDDSTQSSVVENQDPEIDTEELVPEGSKAPILAEKEAISNMSGVNAAEAIQTNDEENSDEVEAQVSDVIDPAKTSLTEESSTTADASEDQNAVEPQNTTENAEQKTAPVVAEGNKVLKLTFSGDCWMQVKDKDGKVLTSGTKKSGDTITLTDSDSYHVTLGAPHVVQMQLDDKPVDLSQYSNGRVARLTVPQAN